MEKKYNKELLQKLKERQRITSYHDVPVLVKNLPDCDEKGAMDPRLYQDLKTQLRMMTIMPKSFMKMDTSEKGIAKLRKMFNAKKSIPCVTADIDIEEQSAEAEDGYKIPVRIYRKDKKAEHRPILFYIHGGGFFGGSMDVVEESMKMLAEKSGICIISVGYRLAPENPYPVGHKDCFTVLKWVAEHAAEFGGDRKSIFVSGDSAGGNLAQYCTTRDWEEGLGIVKGQLLLYPTLNMAGVEDQYFKPEMDQFEMTPKQKKGLSKMIGMFSGMTSGLEGILKTSEVKNDYLNPYTRNAAKNPPTFLAVGEHDFLKIETLGYGVKLYEAGVETKIILYKGFGHAFLDHTGVYPQCEDCIDEMAEFILNHSEKSEIHIS